LLLLLLPTVIRRGLNVIRRRALIASRGIMHVRRRQVKAAWRHWLIQTGRGYLRRIDVA
jgi:hypothetical protein